MAIAERQDGKKPTTAEVMSRAKRMLRFGRVELIACRMKRRAFKRTVTEWVSLMSLIIPSLT